MIESKPLNIQNFSEFDYFNASKELAAVSNYFLKKNKNGSEKSENMTRMKNIKLCYIAHGFMLATLNKPLFSDPIEAWKYGPVIPGLYFNLKNIHKSVELKSVLSTSVKLSQEVCDLLNDVYNVYGKYSAEELSKLTHMPNSPWELSYIQGNNEPISNPLIKLYYLNMLDCNE